MIPIKPFRCYEEKRKEPRDWRGLIKLILAVGLFALCFLLFGCMQIEADVQRGRVKVNTLGKDISIDEIYAVIEPNAIYIGSWKYLGVSKDGEIITPYGILKWQKGGE